MGQKAKVSVWAVAGYCLCKLGETAGMESKRVLSPMILLRTNGPLKHNWCRQSERALQIVGQAESEPSPVGGRWMSLLNRILGETEHQTPTVVWQKIKIKGLYQNIFHPFTWDVPNQSTRRMACPGDGRMRWHLHRATRTDLLLRLSAHLGWVFTLNLRPPTACNH